MQLYALALRVVAIKIIVNALKTDKNAPLYVDALVVKIIVIFKKVKKLIITLIAVRQTAFIF
jgi:hypothetical protein